MDFVSILLEKDPEQRLSNVIMKTSNTTSNTSSSSSSSSGGGELVVEGSDGGVNSGNKSGNGTNSINYDALRKHQFFSSLLSDIYSHDIYNDIRRLNLTSIDSSSSSSSSSLSSENQNEIFKSTVYLTSVKIPKLSELCIRAVAKASVDLSEKIAENGGVRPQVFWMVRFNLFADTFPESFRNRVMYNLHRKQRLHLPQIFRFFQTSVLDARCRRADEVSREYIGHCKDLQVFF
jgi:hypothetical protein